MSAQDRNKARQAEDRARAALTYALGTDRLSDPQRKTAQLMLDRLETPVRIGVLGLPGTGRSQIVNLLAGQRIVPDLANGAALCTLELVHGEEERSTLTLADGSTVTRDDIDVPAIAAQAPVLVRLEADLPALKRISLIEVVAGEEESQQARALGWVAPRVDMAIWCTRDFGAPEQRLWAAAPDALKADGILLRTHADLLREPEALLRVLRYNSADGFDQILAIDTPAALDARDAEGGPDRQAFKATGGQALISTVLRMVERQRALVVDHVDLLLMQTLGTTDPMRPANAPPDVDTPVEAAPKAPAEPAADPAPKAPAEAPLVLQTEARVEAPATPDAVQVALQDATVRLAQAGRDLRDDEASAADAMDRSVAELIWLSEHLDAAEADTAAPGLAPLRDRATDAADLAQLMQLEDSEDAALEAVSLMLQMRRTLSQELALKSAA